MLVPPQSQPVETQISDVTVYEDRALVTRRGMIAISAQTQELIVADLPLTLQTDSVRVSGSGAIAVQDRLDALVIQRNFVQGLSDKSVDRFANSLARGKTDLTQAKGLLTFLRIGLLCLPVVGLNI